MQNKTEVEYYADLLTEAYAALRNRPFPEGASLGELAIIIVQQIGKDRRTSAIGEQHNGNGRDQAAKTKGEPMSPMDNLPPTERQLEFLAKHCNIQNFKGTRTEASKLVAKKMDEWKQKQESE